MYSLLRKGGIDLMTPLMVIPNGILVTSINSANISWKKYEADVFAAARSKKLNFTVVRQIDLPLSFPPSFGDVEARYLKG